MATNLAIDEKLLNDALKIGGLKTKKDTVNAALQEFIQRRRINDIIDMFGQIEYDKEYNYKELRNRNRNRK